MTNKKRRELVKKRYKPAIDVEQILLDKRQLFLFGEINDKLAYQVVQKLIALAQINNNPIMLYINSDGGYVEAGFAIIDCMRGIKSEVITFILGSACSMAGLIAIAGDKRIIAKNAIWMAHDLQCGHHGKATAIIDRAEFIKEEQKKIFDFLRSRTKLSETEIQKAIHGELWYFPEEAVKKGIADAVAE